MPTIEKKNINRKKEGFDGQKAIVLPKKIIGICQETDLVKNLFITDIGFYPKAKFHYRKRHSGISQYILIYCSDGRGWLETDQRMEIEQNEFLLLPAYQSHTYGSDDINPWTIHWLHFSGEQADVFGQLLTLKGTRLVRPVTFGEDRIQLFNSMYNTLESGYSIDNLTFVNMCLWHFLGSFCYPDIYLLPQSGKNKDIIDISIEFMRENLHRSLSIQELASQIYISPSYYSAMFKRKTGYPPLEYFNHIKIQKACQYLQFTDIHVKEVAYKLGINDQFYFSRLFNNVMGISPIDYRTAKKQKRGKIS